MGVMGEVKNDSSVMGVAAGRRTRTQANGEPEEVRGGGRIKAMRMPWAIGLVSMEKNGARYPLG
jgi:hypothetical protein